MKIAEKNVVSIHYTLTNDAGQVLDSSDGREPLEYLHGHGNIIPGLEKSLTGRAAGDKFKVTIPPEDAYGQRDERLVQKIPRNQFPDQSRLQAGVMFQIQGPNGPMVLTIKEVDAQDVTVDGNPELAGQTLHFAIEVTGVRAATSEELDHGHVHGPNGHHHHDS